MNVRTFWKGAAARISNWKVTTSHPVHPQRCRAAFQKEGTTRLQCSASQILQFVSMVQLFTFQHTTITKCVTGSLRKTTALVLWASYWLFTMQVSSTPQFGNHLSRRLKTDQGIKWFEFYCYSLIFRWLYIFRWGLFFLFSMTFLLVMQCFCMTDIKFHDSPFIWPKGANHIRVLGFWIA